MDERSQQLISKGIAITLALLYVALFVSAIWKYVSTKDITNSTLEIILIVMIPASIAWFARKDESLTIPRMMSGETVPTGTDVPSKKARKRHYFWDSLGFALVVLVLNILTTFLLEKDWGSFHFFTGLSDTMSMVILLLIEFLISILVFYAISYMWDEFTIKRYNHKLQELEDLDE
ncbi:hypothetical protein [Bacillus sinesaloumensis]|uniref:hypothetical protein n=1 Tax=Litchfieldia sinesaloumensis TaxID=1926280 RepID=UPI00098847E8|nr:hypothetical protein [Bacillus sinesaloumensis]